jgi:hypothetical protein
MEIEVKIKVVKPNPGVFIGVDGVFFKGTKPLESSIKAIHVILYFIDDAKFYLIFSDSDFNFNCKMFVLLIFIFCI